MEKISHILPPSKRVTTVDTDDSPPVRPGAPTQGRRSRGLNRAQGAESLNLRDKLSDGQSDRVSISPSALDRVKALKEQSSNSGQGDRVEGYRSPGQASKLKTINDLSQRFFNNMKVGYENPREESIDPEAMLESAQE